MGGAICLLARGQFPTTSFVLRLSFSICAFFGEGGGGGCTSVFLDVTAVCDAKQLRMIGNAFSQTKTNKKKRKVLTLPVLLLARLKTKY